MNKYMKMAINEARRGIKMQHGGPFGAVIVKDGRVVAKGHNEVLRLSDPTCHGEVQAIRRCAKKLGTHDLSGCVIYTTGEPCPMCLGAIMWANIDKVYYGCNIDDTEIIGFRDKKFYERQNGGKDEFVSELDREECLKLYNEYASMKDNEIY
jgi:guanine deaminase